MIGDGHWQRLEETVFQINDLSQRLWRRDGYDLGHRDGDSKQEKVADLVPIMFDKASRVFNWVMVPPDLLEAAASGTVTDYVKEAQRIVAHGFASESVIWENFEDRYSQKSNFSEYIRLLQNILKVPAGDGTTPSPDITKNIWTAILMLYASYPHPKDHNVEGILFRILEKCGHSSPAHVKHAVFGLQPQDDWLNLQLWKCSRGATCDIEDQVSFDGTRTMQCPDQAGRYYSDDRVEEAKLVRSALLNPILMNYEFIEKEPFNKSIKERPFVLLVPVYDVWNKREGWGGLHAVLAIFTNKPKPGDEGSSPIGNPEWHGHYDKLLDRCGEFASEIAHAAMRRALARPIKPPYDLVRHFLHVLVEVQDWEEATVFYDGNPHYIFKRHVYEWRKDNAITCKRVRESWAECEIRANGESYEYELLGWPDNNEDNASVDQVRISRPLTFPKEQSSGLDTCNGEFFMWWTAGGSNGCQDLWSKAILSGLSDEERLSVNGTSICFKFPKACRIPPNDDTTSRELLVESYRRQQLDLMRRLIPKVRARRAALRNAVSAIMGRNMSHNIGSHVLARYATSITDEIIKDAAKTKVDARTDFVSYLQKRMDFLAEIGTSDQAYWSQPLVLGDELSRLSLEKERTRLSGEPPLLRYITGKDGRWANVTFVGDADLLFSCPGGTVGVHALYVILENVIRNSARHNDASTGNVEIRVVVSDDLDADGFIKLEIIDLQTKLRKDGSRAGADNACEPWKFTKGMPLKARVERARQDRENVNNTLEKGGAPVKSEIVPDEINYIIEFEPIIDDDGRPSPKYWGIREMQICAQYLRQLSLSDIEDVPWSDYDPRVLERPVIHAECKDSRDGQYNLSYVLYLEEAALLAEIKFGQNNARDITFERKKRGFVTVELGSADVEDDAAAFGSNSRKALDEISKCAFVAGEPCDKVKNWLDMHAWELPLRRLHGTPDKLPERPREILECLFSRLSHQVQEAHNSPADGDLPLRSPVGVVFTDDSLAEKVGVPGFGLAGCEPIAVGKIADAKAWRNWLRDKTRENGNLVRKVDAFVWLDHPNRGAIEKFAGKRGRALSSIYVEPIFSHGASTESIRGLRPSEGWELIAAAQPRIVVLDERVQAGARNVVRRDLTAEMCWPGMRIEVPRKDEANLDSPIFNDCRKYLKGRRYSVDFLVLHLTILERLSTQCNSGEDIFATIDKLKQGTGAEGATIVVVTGRGVSTFARSGSARGRAERHLPVSALLAYLVQQPSKLGLMRVLWSASSPKDKN